MTGPDGQPCDHSRPGWCACHGCPVTGRYEEHCRGTTPFDRGRQLYHVAKHAERLKAGKPSGGVKKLACVHLGEPTGETRECPSCKGTVRVKLMACGVFGVCTVGKELEGVACCVGCERYTPATSS